MFNEEAYWIKKALTDLPLQGASVANIGSSTAQFREFTQPHIHQLVIMPLSMRGAKITHIDLKNDEGIDIVADLTSSAFPKILGTTYDLVLCTNILEHVEDVNQVIDNILAITHSSSYILITVPRRYPLHFDPIDNGFRPEPKDILTLFHKKIDYNLVKGDIISIKDELYYPKKKSRFPLWSYRLKLRFWFGYYYRVTGVLIKVRLQ